MVAFGQRNNTLVAPSGIRHRRPHQAGQREAVVLLLRADGQQTRVKLGAVDAGKELPQQGYLSERMAQAALET